ncbi:unnamed protein product [Camellia sinensis]
MPIDQFSSSTPQSLHLHLHLRRPLHLLPGLKVQRHLFAKNKKLQITDMASRRQVRYNRLATDDDNDYNTGGHDPRFDYTPKSFDKVPWKSIALALFLLALGCMLLFLSYFVFTGHMGGERSQAYGLLGLGILTFLPGFYESRLAYYSWRGADGYRFASIPDY